MAVVGVATTPPRKRMRRKCARPRASWTSGMSSFVGPTPRRSKAFATAAIDRFGAVARLESIRAMRIAPRQRAVRLGSCGLERRHHVLGKPTQLLLEFRGRDALGPMDHEILEPRVLGLDRLDAIDHVRWRTAEPRLLLDAVAQRGHPRGSAGRPPGATLFIGVAHEAERREPLVTLVMCGLEASNGFFLA